MFCVIAQATLRFDNSIDITKNEESTQYHFLDKQTLLWITYFIFCLAYPMTHMYSTNKQNLCLIVVWNLMKILLLNGIQGGKGACGVLDM